MHFTLWRGENDLKAFRKAIDKAKVEVKPIFPEITLFEILLLYREKNRG